MANVPLSCGLAGATLAAGQGLLVPALCAAGGRTHVGTIVCQGRDRLGPPAACACYAVGGPKLVRPKSGCLSLREFAESPVDIL